MMSFYCYAECRYTECHLLQVSHFYCFAGCHYAEYCYSECHLWCRILLVMLSVVYDKFRISIGLLGVVMLSALMPCLAMLSLCGKCLICIFMLGIMIPI